MAVDLIYIQHIHTDVAYIFNILSLQSIVKINKTLEEDQSIKKYVLDFPIEISHYLLKKCMRNVSYSTKYRLKSFFFGRLCLCTKGYSKYKGVTITVWSINLKVPQVRW